MLGKVLTFSKFRLQSAPGPSRTGKTTTKTKLKYETIRVIDTGSLSGAGRMQEGGNGSGDAAASCLH